MTGLCILCTMTNTEGPYVKVHFRLEVQGNWPPASVESLWAVDQGNGTVRLDNIPGSFEASRARTSWPPSPTTKACTGPAKWFGVRRTAPRPHRVP
ncbi:hypothetical protein GCM10010350_81300 [Streptomyces galilaeus]|nr:hypothetical protein GCM10010350_81300 [Streptomyces galilaeus]